MIRRAGCSRFEGMMEDYLDDGLPPLARQVVRLHLATCHACRRTLDRRIRARRLLARLPREAMPKELKDHLLNAYRSTAPPALQSTSHRYSTGVAN